jgi:hypothetical protein
MRIQPSNTGVNNLNIPNLNRPINVVFFEEDPNFPEDSFYYVDYSKLKKELKFRYFTDLFNSSQEFDKAVRDYFEYKNRYSDPEDYINITLKELIEDFKDYIKYET